MKILHLTKQIERQCGFVMIEIIIGVVISALLGGGVITAIYQIGNINSIDNARMIAVKQVESSIHYINRDVQMAQKVEANGQTYWLRLTWSIWSNDQTNGDINQVIYTLTNGVLTRSYTLNGGPATNTVVGRFITTVTATAPNTQTQPPEKAWTIQLTANASHELKQAAETRQVKIIPRPGS
jgi:type II secretory pathway component PulJ